MSVVHRRRRWAGLAAAAAVAAPMLSACTTSPGAAALVGGQRISISNLQADVRAALRDPKAASQFGADRAGFTRQVLAQLVSEDVINAAAAAHHVTVTPQDVNNETQTFVQQAGSLAALQQQAADSGVPADRLVALLRANALQSKLADALTAAVPVTPAQLAQEYQKDIAQYDQVHAAHILVTSSRLAHRLFREVKADPSSFARLAAKYSTDTGSKSKGGDLGFVGRGQAVPAFDRAIFSHKAGSYVLVHSQFGWHIIHVISRRTESLQQATPQLKASLLSSQRQSLVQQAFVAESHKLGVHISPRYGSWDPVKQAVNLTKDPVSVTG